MIILVRGRNLLRTANIEREKDFCGASDEWNRFFRFELVFVSLGPRYICYIHSLDKKTGDKRQNTRKIVCKICRGHGHKADSEDCPAFCREQSVLCFKGPHFVFSNMYRCQMMHSGLDFTSSESAYQWQKAVDLGRPDTAQRIRDAADGFRAKALSKDLDSDLAFEWRQEHGVRVMEAILEAKLEQVPEFRSQLMETGSAVLAECTHDLFWAAGLTANQAKHCKPAYFPGQNMLGKILMNLRERHRNVNNNDEKYSSLVKPNKEYYHLSYVGLVTSCKNIRCATSNGSSIC